jgi:hypothetical protein
MPGAVKLPDAQPLVVGRLLWRILVLDGEPRS